MNVNIIYRNGDHCSVCYNVCYNVYNVCYDVYSRLFGQHFIHITIIETSDDSIWLMAYNL